MALSVYPTPSSGGGITAVTGALSSQLVASGTENGGWYSTTLAAGTYQIYAQTNTGIIAVHSYANNIRDGYIDIRTNERPYILKLTTSDTVTIQSGWSDSLSDEIYPIADTRNLIYFLNFPGSRQSWPWNFKNRSNKFINVVRDTGGGTNHRFAVYDATNGYIPRQALVPSYAVGVGIGNTIGFAGYVNNAYFISNSDQIMRATTVADNAFTLVSGTIPGSYTVDISYGNNMYVAVSLVAASASNLASSTDGVTWALRNSGNSDNRLYCVEWGNNLWVAGGGGGIVSTSTDGYTWVGRATGLSGDIVSVSYNSTAGKWLAIIGTNNITAISPNTPTFATSTNGTTWTTSIPHSTAATAANTANEITTHLYRHQTTNVPNQTFSRNNVVVYNGYWYVWTSSYGMIRSADAITWQYGVISEFDANHGFNIAPAFGKMSNFYPYANDTYGYFGGQSKLTYQIYSTPTF